MKKRILSFFLVAVMLVSMIAAYPMTVSAEGNTFDASAENPQVTTYDDMVAFREAVNSGNSFNGKTISLKADIALGNWTSIGTSSNPFAGNFDGEGHTLSISVYNKIDKYDGQGGLFGFVCIGEYGSVTIENFKLTGSFVFEKGISSFGAVVCYVDTNNSAKNGTLNIENILNSANIDSWNSSSAVGGFVGNIRNTTNGIVTLNITNCVYSGYLTGPGGGQKWHGGILGYTGDGGGYVRFVNMKNCLVTGLVEICYYGDTSKGDNDNGGFVGLIRNGSYKAEANFENCLFAGQFKAKNTDAKDNGYIVAEIGSKNSATLTDCYYVARPVTGSGHLVDCLVKDGTATITGGGKTTLDELAAMTAGSNFTNDSEWVFGESMDSYTGKLNIPIPKSIYDTFLDIKLHITNYEEFLAFKAEVESGNTYSGVKVLLDTDIVLPEDWDGIGDDIGSDNPFKGTFDGQGHTITMSGHKAADGAGVLTGALFDLVGDATIKNLTLDGKMTMVQGSLQGALIVGAYGNTTVQNVRCSVNVKTEGNLQNSGALIAYTFGNSATNLIIDSCVFDGIINAKNGMQQVGGLLGFVSKANHNVTIKNSVNAGTIMFNDNQASYSNGAFVGNIAAGSVTVMDSYSIGKMTFDKGTEEAPKTWADTQVNYILAGVLGGTVSASNVYYVGINNGDNTDMALAPSEITGNAVKMTKAEIAALTADNLSADAFLFKASTDSETYYPCPKGLVGEDGEWIDSLKVVEIVVIPDAKVLGAQIRCTNEADQYSGIRFVTEFQKSAVANYGTADANFGVILISLVKYNALSDKTDMAALEANGVKVSGSKVDEADTTVTVKAVVYNIDAANYKDEIVCIAYIGDAVVGDAVVRSIYSVATKCVEDADASAEAIAFSQKIIDTADGAN